MPRFKLVLIAAFASILFGAVAASHAQISIGINLGSAPVCAYGYYGYAPYRCAPYGYYGPDWFQAGNFVGAGQWYRGGDFYGRVNRQFDPRYGYRGPYPARGGRFDGRDFRDFRGGYYSDPRGRYQTEQQYARHDNGKHRGEYKQQDNGNRGGEYDRHDNGNHGGDGDRHDNGKHGGDGDNRGKGKGKDRD